MVCTMYYIFISMLNLLEILQFEMFLYPLKADALKDTIIRALHKIKRLQICCLYHSQKPKKQYCPAGEVRFSLLNNNISVYYARIVLIVSLKTNQNLILQYFSYKLSVTLIIIKVHLCNIISSANLSFFNLINFNIYCSFVAYVLSEIRRDILSQSRWISQVYRK